MEPLYVDIHTHRPTGCGIELRAAGIHPWEAATAPRDGVEARLAAAQAAGEIGLDFACAVDRGVQQEVLELQLAAAERLGKPVVLHCVRAFEPLMKTLGRYRLPAVIFHGFIGSPEQAARALAAGCCLSFGDRTPRSPKSVRALQATPLRQLFLETDESGRPIGEIYRMAAELRHNEPEVLRCGILENYKRIFELEKNG